MAASLTYDPAGSVNYRRPAYLGIIASALLTILVIVGSRNLEHFDSALVRLHDRQHRCVRGDRFSLRGLASAAGDSNVLAAWLAAFSRPEKTF